MTSVATWPWKSVPVRPLAVIAGYLLLSIVLTKACFALPLTWGSFPWYPADALGFALICLFGMRYAPVLIAGPLLTFLWLDPSRTASTVEDAVMYSVLYAGSYTAGCALLFHISPGAPRLQRLRDVGSFVVTGGLFCPLLFAVALTGFYVFAGHIPRGEFGSCLMLLWGGQAVSIVTLTPFLLVHGRSLGRWLTGMPAERGGPRKLFRWKLALEIVMLAGAITMSLWLASQIAILYDVNLFYLCFLPLIWIAAQYGLGMITGLIVATNAGVMMLAALQSGFAGNLVDFRVVILTFSVTALFLGALVTEREAAERARARMVAVLEATPDFVATADVEGRGLFINRAGRRMMGLASDVDPARIRMSQIYPRWASEMVTSEGLPAAARYGAWSGETALLGYGGREIPISQVLLSHRSPSGEVEFYSTVGRDISERKRAEISLREANETLRAVIDASPLAIVMMSLDSKVVYWSRSAEQLFGWTAAEVNGKPLPIIPVEELPEFQATLERCSRGEAVANRERKRLRKDGSMFDAAIWCSLRRDAAGRVIGLVLIVADVTERRSLEEQLRQAQKMEAIGNLAGGVAHDFNNLLTVIAGYADLLTSDFDAEDPRLHQAREIASAAGRASALTGQLLAFSRRQHVQLRVVDVNELIHGMRTLLQSLLGERVRCEIKLAFGLPRIEADPVQIEQVVMNLAINARDAMAKGGRLRIETSRVEDGEPGTGRRIQLTVSDNGHGMDEVTRNRAFEPFFTTKPRGKGTGLGLATVYGIVQQHGGTLMLESEIGKGTTFRILLNAAAHGQDTSEDPEHPTPIAHGKETILLVEDEAGVRRLTAELLRKFGYSVVEAANAREATSIFHQPPAPIHLLLTDIVMPGPSGRELADSLRRVRTGLKVVYMSGYNEEADHAPGFLETGIPLLQKPFKAEALARTVRETLDS